MYGGQPAQALACHLAAALIHALTGSAGTDDSVQAAATDLRVFGTDAVPPTDVADLCSRLSDIPGTDLPGLIATLSSDPGAADQVLRDLIDQAALQVERLSLRVQRDGCNETSAAMAVVL